MPDRSFRAIFIFSLMLAGMCRAEQRDSHAQSPRQAIIEMFSGSEAQFKQHLTVEMQAKLQEMKSSSAVPLLANARASDPDQFQAFDLGPILFSFNNPEQHERYEVQIESEEARGDEDIMGLSLHLIRNGLEQEIPVAVRFVL